MKVRVSAGDGGGDDEDDDDDDAQMEEERLLTQQEKAVVVAKWYTRCVQINRMLPDELEAELVRYQRWVLHGDLANSDTPELYIENAMEQAIADTNWLEVAWHDISQDKPTLKFVDKILSRSDNLYREDVRKRACDEIHEFSSCFHVIHRNKATFTNVANENVNPWRRALKHKQRRMDIRWLCNCEWCMHYGYCGHCLFMAKWLDRLTLPAACSACAMGTRGRGNPKKRGLSRMLD